MTMHTYRRSEFGAMWQVGLYDALGLWHTVKEFSFPDDGSEERAAAFASYLNGGARPQ